MRPQAEKSQLDNHRVSRFLDTLPQRSARVLDLLQPGPAAASSLSCASTWGASSAAMAWFARFFTDTLVQVSLVSINSCFQVGIFLGCGWLIRYGRAYELRTDTLAVSSGV